MQRAVILGSSGFVGRALVRGLAARGVEVKGFSSTTLDLTRDASLAALDAATGGAVLFFVAALTPDRGATARTMALNVAMAANLAAHLETTPQRPARIVHLGTDAVYPAAAERVDESTPTSAEGYYAIGKLAAEGAVTCAARAIKTPLLVLRPTGIFGPGDPHNSYGPNRFLRAARSGGPINLFGDGEELRDHLYVEDFVRVALDLAASDATGLVNVASGESRTFDAVAREIVRLAPAVEIARLPRAAGAVITHRHYDVARLRALLPGFSPTPLAAALGATFRAPPTA